MFFHSIINGPNSFKISLGQGLNVLMHPSLRVGNSVRCNFQTLIYICRSRCASSKLNVIYIREFALKW